MIKVTPPAGWIAPESETDISASISSDELGDSAGVVEGDFEDIEHILARPQQPTASAQQTPRQKTRAPLAAAPHPKVRNQSAQQRRPRSTRPPQQNAQAAGSDQRGQSVSAPTNQAPIIDGPVLPNDQWTSDGTRKRKRVVTAIVGVIGTLILLGAVGAAIVFNLTKPPTVPAEQAAANPQFGNDPELVDNDDGMLDDEDLADTGPFAAIDNDLEDKTEIDVGMAPPDDGQRPRGDESRPVKHGAQTIADATAVEPRHNQSKLQELSAPDVGDDSADDPEESNDPEQDPVAPPKLGTNSPFAGTKPNPEVALSVEPSAKLNRPIDVGMVEAFESDLGDLSALLEASGTSILDFKDLTASIRTSQIVGIPKYIVSLPDPAKFDLPKQLEMPIGGLKYDAAPLAQVLQNLAAITGVPITVDARSIAAVGKASNPEVTIMISDSTLVEALTEMLAPIGLSHAVHPGGLTVGVFPSVTMTPTTFELPGSPDIDVEGKKRLIRLIQVLVDPQSWARTDDPATIVLEGDQIVVNCTPAAQTQIRSLLSKLDSSLVLARKPDDAIALANTTSRWTSIKPNLAKDPVLVHSVQTEIDSFLKKLHTKSGVSTIIDWQHVVVEGWTPRTIVPGNIRELSVEKTVAELARAMDLTFVAVDETTLMMTTFEQTAKMVDLETYPLSTLVPDRLGPKQLMELVSESLGVQLQSERVKYIYEPNYQCLVVSAPQQIQRQIEALVDRLQRDLITPDRRPNKTQQAMKPLAN